MRQVEMEKEKTKNDIRDLMWMLFGRFSAEQLKEDFDGRDYTIGVVKAPDEDKLYVITITDKKERRMIGWCDECGKTVFYNVNTRNVEKNWMCYLCASTYSEEEIARAGIRRVKRDLRRRKKIRTIEDLL